MLQLTEERSEFKGKLLIDDMRQDVIRALCCTVIRLCHKNSTCATDMGNKQCGVKLQNEIALTWCFQLFLFNLNGNIFENASLLKIYSDKMF